jgi:RsiW-degrading membrane proteinase PrsW (M82 family)
MHEFDPSGSFRSSWKVFWEALQSLNQSSFGEDPMLATLLIVSSICVAAFPMLSFLGMLWWLDRYHREPLWLLGLTFLWGALLATTISFLGNTILGNQIQEAGWFNDNMAGFVQVTFLAPLVEEPSKAAVLFIIARSRYFNTVTDGFVFGAAAGLGFGMTENFFYFAKLHGTMMAFPEWGFSGWLEMVTVRSLGSAMMHAVATSCLGAALAWARFRGRMPSAFGIFTGTAIAMGMHALWNGLASISMLEDRPARAAAVNAGLENMLFVLFALEFLIIFFVFQLCLLNERRTIREELIREAEEEGTLPPEHVPFLGNNLARIIQRFAPPGVPQEAYIRAATVLAFRREQARRAPRAIRAFYQQDLVRLRGEVRALLAQEEVVIDAP